MSVPPEFAPGAGSSVDDRPVDYTTAGEMVNPDIPAPADVATPPPPDILPVSPQDAPFKTTEIPRGWNRLPTEAEVAWLNAEYGTSVPVSAPAPAPAPADPPPAAP